jgi:hypothetical protein
MKLDADDKAKALFLGVAPERASDLDALWTRYQPSFSLVAEMTAEGSFVMRAGMYKFVEFNHRVSRAFWLGAYIAWEAYSATHAAFNEAGYDTKRFNGARLNDLLTTFDAMLTAEDSASVPMPHGIPEPGVYPPRTGSAEALAPAELATIAVGWALLHETRHIMRQQENLSPAPDAPRAEQHADELHCDAFAARFLLEGVANYATLSGYDEASVRQKRQIGVLFGLFVLALVDSKGHQATDTHPALQDRVNALGEILGLTSNQVPLVVGLLAFFGLSQVRPHQLTVRAKL